VAGTYPAVIVLHEAFGLVEHERDVARRFANAGFIALAPDVYSRVGAPQNAADMTEVRAKMFGITDAQLVRDFEAAAAFVRAHPAPAAKSDASVFASADAGRCCSPVPATNSTRPSIVGADSSRAPLRMR
jgi:dienelactone hydrolase